MTVDERLEDDHRVAGRRGIALEAPGRVVTEVQSLKLPRDLIDIGVGPTLPGVDRFAHVARERGSQPMGLGFHMVPNRAVDVIELEQCGGHRATTGQPRLRRPPEPLAEESTEPRDAWSEVVRPVDDLAPAEPSRTIPLLVVPM